MMKNAKNKINDELINALSTFFKMTKFEIVEPRHDLDGKCGCGNGT